MRIDQPDDADGDSGLQSADTSELRKIDANQEDTAHAARGEPAVERDPDKRTARSLDHKSTVDADYRAYAIDQGCERVRKIEEKTVTPAMLRIEAEDPSRRLAGLDNRLKGKDRLTAKVENWLNAQPGLKPNEAFSLVKDTIRYTFVYDEENYTAGVYADCERLADAGFEPGDRENSWEKDQYKGINGRWRETTSGILFEVQFHTQASLDAKEETHWAYERIRDPATPPGEVGRLRAYQREVYAKVAIPPGAADIPNYNYL